MNLHEYQAKQLLKEYGLPVPKGILAHNVEEAISAMERLNTTNCVVKAQIHAGGRGKSGGIKLTNNKEDLISAVNTILHKNLITYQTDKKGLPVNILLIEEALPEIEKEIYLGIVLDNTINKIVIIASTEGGVEIEKVAIENPGKIIKVAVSPLVGIMPYQCRKLAFALNLNTEQASIFSKIVAGISKLFVEKDLSLLEINPLVITKNNHLICLDCKINVDENSLYRQPSLKDMRDISQEDVREIRAKEFDLNYIALDGNIGCMVNGAGLAMATMDLIKLYGGEPANFLDVGGSANKERVTEAFKIILSDNNVNGILVNIFGGIVRCDLIADGILEAVAEAGIKIPVVVRLEGNRAKEAIEILNKSNVNIIAANSLQDAVKQIITAVKEKI